MAVVILALFQVTTGFAARWDDGTDALPAVTSCADNASFFPTSVYTKIDTSESGVFSGFEIHISNKDGDCSALLYSSHASESNLSLSHRQNNDKWVIVER